MTKDDDTDEPAAVEMRATATAYHNGRRVVAGAVVLSTDPLVARVPGCFEPVAAPRKRRRR